MKNTDLDIMHCKDHSDYSHVHPELTEVDNLNLYKLFWLLIKQAEESELDMVTLKSLSLRFSNKLSLYSVEEMAHKLIKVAPLLFQVLSCVMTNLGSEVFRRYRVDVGKPHSLSTSNY